jgi:hypothetical protein
LSGAAQYAGFAVYFVLRWFTGELPVTLALYPALLACLFACGTASAARGIVENADGRAAILIFAPLLVIAYPFAEAESFILADSGHSFTFALIFFCYGFFFRFMRRPQGWLMLAAALALASCLRASDKLFALWFFIPAAVMCIYLIWKQRMPKRDAACWMILTGICELTGRGIDAALRNFPTHFNPGLDFNQMRVLRMLGYAVLQTWRFATAEPHITIWFICGVAGMILTYKTGTTRQRDSILFLLFVMILIPLGIAAHGYNRFPYYIVLYVMPYAVGGMLFLAWVILHLPARVRMALPMAAVVLPVAVTFFIRSALPAMNPPYLPELALEMDELARTHGVRTGLADFWDARPVNIFSKEGVTLLPIGSYGYTFVTFNHTRAIFRDRVDMLVDNPASGPYNTINRDLEIRHNGEPDEIITLKNGREVLIYHNGVCHPTEADLVLDGELLMPERAEGDRIQWTGEMRLSGNLTLTEFHTLPRNDRHLALLVFKDPLENILGKKFVLAAVGDKLNKRKRELALRMSGEGDAWLDWFYSLFMTRRNMTITLDNSAVLPDGSSAAWGKLPNWDSREWLALFIYDEKTRHRIK